jgi:7,8-dihydropterin-6-yl-methyl-4-(beta-D-ribofuranosyl)aminobenzene 5'-phosphate synthase
MSTTRDRGPVELIILYDNTAFDLRLGPGWGFSCLVRHQEGTVLFDTGAEGELLLANMDQLGIDPEDVDLVFLSHSHFDHTGGVPAFRRANPRARVYYPETGRWRGQPGDIGLYGPQEIFPGVYTTGVLKGMEQSLLLRTSRGVAVLSGCAHPGVGPILEAAAGFGEVWALIGGLHDFKDFDLVSGLELICPTHCTAHEKQLRKRFPQACLQGGAGRRIVLEEPFSPQRWRE